MGVLVFHFSCPKGTSLEDVAQSILSASPGYKALVSDFAAELDTLKQKHSVDLWNLLPLRDLEVICSLDSSEAVLLRAVPQEDRRSRPRFEARVLAPLDTATRLFEAFVKMPILDEGLRLGTYREGIIADQLEERLKVESPVGKKLSNPRVAGLCEALQRDELRSGFAKFVDAFGAGVVPRDLALAHWLEGPPQMGANLIESGLLNRRFLISCQTCGEVALSLKDAESAELALAAADLRCRVCEGGPLVVTEGYASEEAAIEALRGLWLEKLVFDFVQSRWIKSFHSRMLDTNELDVVIVYGDRLALFECKDRGFGQNDYYVLAMKAQELGAEVAVIVTTSPVHENVRALVRRQNEGEGSRQVALIECSRTEDLRGELARFLGTLAANYESLPTESFEWSTSISAPILKAFFDDEKR